MNQKAVSSIYDIEFSTLRYSAVITKIVELAKIKNSAYVCPINVNTLIVSQTDGLLKDALQNANIKLLSGMPLCWSIYLLNGIKAERIIARDLIDKLILQCVAHQLPIYLYGSKQKTLNRSVRFLRNNYPKLTIAGSYSPPFRNLTDKEDAEVISKLKASGAAIVFVSLSCPKQEIWLASMKEKIPAVMIGVGSALKVLSYQKRSPPNWMQYFGLEWLFRLCLEPKRLFRRYLITNTQFSLLFLKAFIVKIISLKKH